MSEVFDKATEKAEEGLAGLGERLYSEYEKLPWYKQLLLAIAPVTGETISAYETPIFAEKTKEAYKKGDFLETAGHGALTGLSVLGAIPFLGAGIRGVKAGVKGLEKGLTSLGETRKIKDTLLKEVERRPDFKGHAKDVHRTEDSNILKNVFNPDKDYAASIVAEARHGDVEIVDPVSPRILKSTKKQIYEATQKALENFPDEIKVYRMAPKDAPFNLEGVDSFSLDPKFSGSSLPWATEGAFGPLKKNYKLTEYLVDKKDILAAPNALWKGAGTVGEQEVILRTAKLKGSGGLSGLGEPTISPLRKAFDKSPASKLAEIPPQIDETGLTAYHGTIRGERIGEGFFDIDFAHPLDQFLGEGHYLTINPKRAERYANIRASADLGFRPVRGGRGDTRYYSDELDTFTNTENLLKGLDEKGKPFLSGQTIARFDVSKLEKPFIVDTNKKRLYAKRNIDKLKEEGYDSIIFKDFSDKSQQILVFPEHIKKVKSRLQGGLIGYK